MCSIFHLAKVKPFPHLGTVDIHRQNLSVVHLTGVCQVWRRIAIQDSILWCNIAFSTSRLSTIRCAAAFLRRSRDATLKVQIIDIQNRATITHPTLVANLMDEISQRSHRIVEFEAVGFSELISEALIYRADNLDRLTITGRSSEKLPVIFRGQMLRLKRLTLSNPTGWKLRLFQDVTKVTIFCYGGDLRVGSLIDFLDGARNLQSLSLSRFRDCNTDSRMVVRQPVTLPSLRELNLSFCDTSRILAHLDLPSSAHISILAGPELESQDILQHLPSSPSFWQFLSDTKSLTLSLNAADDEFYMSTCHREKPSCFLRVYDDRKRLDKNWVLRSINAASQFKPFFNIDSLTVSAGNCQIPWGTWLPKLDWLTSLEVRSVDLEELVLALHPTKVDFGHVPCPALRYLSIKGSAVETAFDSSALRSCLLARATAGFPVFRLRVRSKDWKGTIQPDPRWKELVLSQGEVSGLLTFLAAYWVRKRCQKV